MHSKHNGNMQHATIPRCVGYLSTIYFQVHTKSAGCLHDSVTSSYESFAYSDLAFLFQELFAIPFILLKFLTIFYECIFPRLH